MVQNRNKLIELFIGNFSNFIIHKVLEETVNSKFLANKYGKEMLNSLVIAKKYRNKINPIENCLSYGDIVYIRNRVINKVRNELRIRLSKGYTNIDINLIERFVDKYLKEMEVME